MKISTFAPHLLSQLQAVSRVTASRSAVSALSGVMITTPDESSAELRATDMEVALRVPLAAEVDSPGTAVLPARLLLDITRSLPAEPVRIELRAAEQDVELVCGAATFHLRMLRTEDFPSLPEPTPETRIVLPVGAFVQTVGQVARSASRDETRPVLTGIMMSASGDELQMVATDSYRLSVKTTKLELPLGGSLEANVPARALQELVRVAPQGESDTVAVSVGKNQVVFELGEIVLSSRLIDGQFPNYRQLLPEGVEHELRLASAEFTEVVRRVSLLAQKNVPLRLSFSDGTLLVSAQTPDIGEASEAIPVPFEGEPLDIGFNPDFLRDGLESVESDEFLLKLISPLRPGLIESPEGGDFVYLIMPIRLGL
jgi:DNA polymerase-3 subunit beta